MDERLLKLESLNPKLLKALSIASQEMGWAIGKLDKKKEAEVVARLEAALVKIQEALQT